MNIIVLAAGQGSRFLKEGIKIPKPLILYKKKPLFWWAANSLIDSFNDYSLYFVFREEHIKEYNLEKYLSSFFKSSKIISIPELTSGPAETAYLASKEIFNKSSPSIFCDSDITFSINKYNLKQKLKGSYNSIAFTFKSTNPAYSYLLKDKTGLIIDAVEKRVVSNSALTGAYLFKSIDFYNSVYKKTFLLKSNDEKYMSNILSKVIKLDPSNFLECDLIDNISLGTPREFKDATKFDKTPKWFLDARF